MDKISISEIPYLDKKDKTEIIIIKNITKSIQNEHIVGLINQKK